MRKFISLFLTLLTLSVGQMWGTPDETITFSSVCSADESLHEGSKTGTDFSVYFNKGTNSNAPVYKTTGYAVRVYGGGYFIVSSTTKTITKIELTFGSGDGTNAITTADEAYENSVWEGSASSVTFTVGGTTGHRRLASVAVTYASNVSYDVHWNVNGQNITTISTSSKPSVPAAAKSAAEAFDCEGKVFVGWSSASVTGSAPADLFTEQAGSAISGETTYNAVFATETPGGTTSKAFSFTISSSNFVTTGYADNNGSHTSTATATDNSGETMSVSWTSSNVMAGTGTNAGKIQFKSSAAGYLYNTTSLDAITNLSVSGGSGVSSFQGASQNPTSNGTPKNYFRVGRSSGTGYATSITVTFTKSVQAPPTYSNYTTQCCTSLGQINGSFLGTTHFCALSPEKFSPERP